MGVKENIKMIRAALDEAMAKEEARIKSRYGHPEKCEYEKHDNWMAAVIEGCKYKDCHDALEDNNMRPLGWFSVLSDIERYIYEAGHDPENFIIS